jgi:hypothetical protein
VLLAIDPGTEVSGVVGYDDGDVCFAYSAIANGDLLHRVRAMRLAEEPPSLLAVEMVASYGMPVGREVFETVLWAGRFIEAWGGPFQLVYRRDVKLHLCGTPRAKDANVSQAIRDLYGKSKREVMGTKKQPGPLYGVSKHAWAALGVAITAAEGAATGDQGDATASFRIDG